MEDSNSTMRRNPRRGGPPPPAAGLPLRRNNPPRAARTATAPTSASPAPPAPPAPPRAHPPSPPSPQRCPATAAAVDIRNLHNDKRGYRHIVLSNKLRCVLVSDPSSEKMAVALSAPAGYFSDPNDYEGLSDLLHHALFRGSPSYPTFHKLLLENNGSIKSMVHADRASFCADASTRIFEDVLTGFAGFFIKPSFSCTSSETDTNSDINEKPSDLDILQRYLTKSVHPYHKFRPGNKWFVLESLKAKGVETAVFLREFYESHYSADLMSVVIFGSGSLEDMQEVATKNFSSLRISEMKPNPLLTSLFTDETFQVLVKVPSMDGRKTLRVQWLVEHSSMKPEQSDAVKYILHVFNYNSEGSLFNTLEHVKKWSSKAQAHETFSHSKFKFLSLDITLTDEGMRHYEDVCGLVFRYIMMLKAFKPRKYIFEELKRVSMEQLSCEEMVNPIDCAAKIASNILTFPPDYCLVGSVPTVYSENAIRAVQNLLSAERVRFFLVSGEFEGQTNLVEPVHNTSYSIESVKGAIQDWIKNAPKIEMYLPGPEKAKKAVHKQPYSTSQSTHRSASVCVLSDTSEDNKTSFVPQGTQHAAKVCLIFDERMKKHVDKKKKHQESPKRIQAIFDRLEADGLLNRCSVFGSEDAKLPQIMLAHSEDHIRRIIKGDLTGTGMYFEQGSMEAILLAAGGAIKASDMVASGKFNHAFALVRPPGHHASSDEDGGFCYFNNVAIAAKHLQKEYNFKKIMIFDFDIHFGDGTSKIFIEDSGVLYASMHCPLFPFGTALLESEIGVGDGKGYNCNVVWSKPVNDDDFCVVVDYLILPMAQSYSPDIILVSAGFDAALGDLYKYHVTPAGYAAVIQQQQQQHSLLSQASWGRLEMKPKRDEKTIGVKLLQLEKPLVLVLEGGYNPDVLGKCCSCCIRVLDGDTSMINDKNEYTPLKSTWKSVTRLKELLHPYYPSLGAKIPPEILSRCVCEHPIPNEVT